MNNEFQHGAHVFIGQFVLMGQVLVLWCPAWTFFIDSLVILAIVFLFNTSFLANVFVFMTTPSSLFF
jgi:hypothetical protein